MTEDLKPCPFCGSPATLYEFGDCHPRYVVYCDNDHCMFSGELLAIYKENIAVEKWNTRVEPNELPEWLKNTIETEIDELVGTDFYDALKWVLSLKKED